MQMQPRLPISPQPKSDSSLLNYTGLRVSPAALRRARFPGLRLLARRMGLPAPRAAIRSGRSSFLGRCTSVVRRRGRRPRLSPSSPIKAALALEIRRTALRARGYIRVARFGILAAIAIPLYANVQQRARIAKAQADSRALASAASI